MHSFHDGNRPTFQKAHEKLTHLFGKKKSTSLSHLVKYGPEDDFLFFQRKIH